MVHRAIPRDRTVAALQAECAGIFGASRDRPRGCVSIVSIPARAARAITTSRARRTVHRPNRPDLYRGRTGGRTRLRAISGQSDCGCGSPQSMPKTASDGESNRRDVRPSDTQLSALTDYFLHGRSRALIPMADIMWFAIYSARRESEICRLRWTDNDPRSRTGVVRDLKHPQHTLGNHRRFRYTPEGWQIALRQPRTGALIFPNSPQCIKAAFHGACRRLGIDNLHFHDLRHEATSRLFERGYEIHEVQQFTLHSSWQQLKRYTHLRPEQIPDLPYPPLDT